jgi:ParB family chromosome partitioning protein
MPNTTKTVEIDVANLVPFANHPFKLYQGKRSEALINSVRESGVLTPIIVRPQGKKYEILSGHNRVEAAKKVGLQTVPAIVREDLSDDDARLIVTVTNLIQRSFSDLSHSERAAALSEHYEAIKNQGKRTDILNSISTLLGEDETCVTVRHRLKARDVISKTYGIGGTVVAQYIRVAKLSEPLQERLDNGELSLRAAVQLSHLSATAQTRLDKVLAKEKRHIEVKTANDLREKESELGKELDEATIKRIIGAKKKTEQETRSVKIDNDLISQYFDDGKTDSDISNTIAKALEAWFANGGE